jgi:hypothetical protein
MNSCRELERVSAGMEVSPNYGRMLLVYNILLLLQCCVHKGWLWAVQLRAPLISSMAGGPDVHVTLGTQVYVP